MPDDDHLSASVYSESRTTVGLRGENVFESNEEIRRSVASVADAMVSWRRHLHEHPELSFEERETSRFVARVLEETEGIEVEPCAGTSLVARLRGRSGGRTIALRADMDALPVEEENDVPYRSRTPGVMHACGHDGHVAMMLGAARVLAARRERLHGEIRFLFQHAEEKLPGGAEAMIAAGAMDGVDAVAGAHLWSDVDVGRVAVTYGPMMAAPDAFRIVVDGRGGHASRPHQTVDSLAVAAQIVTNLQQLVSRETDPMATLVVSVCSFHAGRTHNVISGQAELEGTVRSYDPALRERAARRIEEIAQGVASAHRALCRIEYTRGYRPVVNHEGLTRLLDRTAQELFGREAVDYTQRNMGGEDFSAFQARAPGTFYYIGVRNRDRGIVHPNHHPRFDIDEAALVHGATLHCAFARRLLDAESFDAPAA
jgi:amidohydrolase